MFVVRGIRLLRRIFSKMNNIILLRWKKCHVGANVRINGSLRIYGNKGRLFIADDVIINSAIEHNPIGGWSGCSFLCIGDGSIRIEKGAGISNSAFCSASSITVGRQAFIGGGCRIYDTDFHSIDFAYRTEIPDMHIKTKPVIIEEGAFIGGGTIILKGVVIGKYSVVGAGSVVTRSIPPGEIWAGNPARFIRKLE